MLKFSTTPHSSHNERKVTCKHPVSGLPSQDNCIFVVNEHVTSAKLVHPVTDPLTVNPVTVNPVTANPVTDPVTPVTDPVTDPVSNRPKAPEQAPSEESDGVKKERPMSTMSEASNYTGGSDYSTYPGSSPATRPSRSSKKVHNFGKRSNSIKRNPNAPAVKSNWLYKQDSTGMKLWKKRWFVLSDMCLFYYRDEKEEGILGSILLPSFHISMLSVDDHISRKYAFKATHSNMRTYYFCTDTAKDMESWMKVMTDAAMVHIEPIRRLEKLKVDRGGPQEVNNILNHNRVLTRPEIQNNERNREPRQPSLTRSMDRTDGDRKHKDPEKHNTLQRERERYTLQKDGERYSLQKDGRDGSAERPLTKINSIKLQPAQAAAIAAAVTASRQGQASQHMAPPQINGSGERAGDHSPGEVVVPWGEDQERPRTRLRTRPRSSRPRSQRGV
ncbi:hypothetical protein J4Q44_G00144530 [Coregonus suidteri]|uniref:PH domain-containing protein n=1 Tax=Coregonus suidteri TaxID=861788 RepID=A0AAN8LR78_9TELE